MMKPLSTLILTLSALLPLRALHADVVPSALFSDYMVLQRDMPVPVWGQADAGEQVSVEFAGQRQLTTADENGRWMVTLKALKASTQGRSLRIIGDQVLVFKDVLVGEVWICSGQSNMQFHISNVPEIEALLSSADNVRSFEVKRTVAFEPQTTLKGEWTSRASVSAVAAGFSILLEQAIDVPVGIIHSSWGSSSIEGWMPRELSKQLPLFEEQLALLEPGSEARTRIQSALDGKTHWEISEDIYMRRHSNIIYNAMMHPLAPYACRGLVWYQGERNAANLDSLPSEPWYRRNIPAIAYGEALKLLIQSYRQLWRRDNLHFMVVMLPGYAKGVEADAENPTAPSWAWMRESQLKALELPHTSVATTIDCGHLSNIHPTDKLPIAERLALLAQRDTLGIDLMADGPVMKDIELHDDQIIVHYHNANGLTTTDCAAPKSFWIAGATGQWVPAEAELRGETVVLHAEGLERPLYVRYAFAGKPRTNLVNAAELPARPFRTDTFLHDR